MKPACSRCKHYEGDETTYVMGPGHGECRAHPPGDDGWPGVRDNDWCGEFVALDPVTDRQRTTEET